MKKNILKVSFILFLIATSVLIIFLFIQKQTPISPYKNNIDISKTSTQDACIIIPEEYCGAVTFIDWESGGETYILAALSLPKDTEIKTPLEGTVGVSVNGDGWNGSVISVKSERENTRYSVTFIGDISYQGDSNMYVSVGDVVGKMGNTGVTNKGDYNLLIRVSKYKIGENVFTADNELLKSFFER